MKNTLETRLGIFVALVVIAAVLILETVGGEHFQRGYKLNALFSNVQDLKVGNQIKMAGVEIGRVQDIMLTNNKVWVVMKVREKALVKTDSLAKVQFTGLMGQNFVAVDFGTPSAPKATDGTYLPTAEQPDLSAMMSKIDEVASGVQNLTKSFTGFQIDKLLGPFTDFMKANQAPLTATIANMKTISSAVAEGKGTVGKLINDPELYNQAMLAVTNLEDTATQLKLTIADAHKVVDQVNSGQGTVGKLLKDDKLYVETTASMTNMKEILQKINKGQGSVGKLVNDDELIKNAKLTLQKLDQATEGLEDQGPLSVLGTAVSKLF
jgi:phospholipid/cholesterol/gamma-HCH transport system substrate-binding protein